MNLWIALQREAYKREAKPGVQHFQTTGGAEQHQAETRQGDGVEREHSGHAQNTSGREKPTFAQVS